MAKKKKASGHYSGIGGQAVLEGIMMKNGDHYAVAVHKPDDTIAVKTDTYKGVGKGSVISKLPLIRGVFSFIDSLVLGMSILTYSAAFYEEEEEPTKLDQAVDKVTGGHSDKLFETVTMIISVVLALGIFVALPYGLSLLFRNYIRNASLLALVEGVMRLAIFLCYVTGVSLMKDIRRTYMYHGAEHKCINCLERGKLLTVKNVRNSSRMHKRCGTSFLLFVVIVSIVLFMFIRVDDPLKRLGLRILLIPVVAGISYEIIRLAGRYDNPVINLLSAPGMLVQRLTTREPDDEMIRVAITAVDTVYDWRGFLHDEFDMDIEPRPIQWPDEPAEVILEEPVAEEEDPEDIKVEVIEPEAADTAADEASAETEIYID